MFQAFVQWRQRSRAIRELSRLSDTELADLGLARRSIAEVVREPTRIDSRLTMRRTESAPDRAGPVVSAGDPKGLRVPLPGWGKPNNKEPVMIKTFATKLAAWRRYRESVRELSRLSDRELNDLGIGRSDIQFVVRQSIRLEA